MAAKERNALAKTNPIFSLASGTFAGAVEGFATYPIEYTKTVSQFATKAGAKVGEALTQPPNPFIIVKDTVASHGIVGLYSGCGALVAGNALKVRGSLTQAGVRFLSYDHFKSMLKDKDVRGLLTQGKLSGPRSLLAGLGAGMAEAIFAVTPSETIKCVFLYDTERS